MSHIEIRESLCPAAKYMPPSPILPPEIARVDTGVLGESGYASSIVTVV
jgi:hypothetical protein